MCNKCSVTLSVPDGALWRHRQKDGTMHERYTFGDNIKGLQGAWDITESLRRAGYRTHLEHCHVEHCHVAHTDLVIVVAIPPKRPNRKARGAIL